MFKHTISALLLAAASLTFGAEHQVMVGGPGGLVKYDPPFIQATVGDVVTFVFKQKNHTVTRSTFENPCQAMQGPDGFDSGFVPVSENNTDGPFTVAQVTVEDTNPIWIYCRQANHCQQGMVFAINPGDKFAAFQAAAMGTGNASASPSSSAAASSATAPGTNASAPPASATGVATVTATVIASGTQQVTTYGSYPGSAAPTAVSSSDHKVIVGGPNKLVFDPPNITAQVGDTITFEFHQKNHTATQSTFANPCKSLTETSTSGQVGFDSGFMPVADGATNFPTYTIQVNDTTPIWAFCAQANHCAQGMVFAANAVESGPNNFAAFQEKAKQSGSNPSASSTGAVSPSASQNSAAGRNVNTAGVGRGAGFALALAVVLFRLL
ncbi:hypothetical protein K474DRAFT_1681264 [Panus rudis PR-1116 ss-1]|nr:hypothetical protein K474DRAFT_1681264 [Panus rudis PR-1116 ss-1]